MGISQISNGTWGGFRVGVIGLFIVALATFAYSLCLLGSTLFGLLFLLGWLTVVVGFVIHVRHMARSNSKESREKRYAKTKQPWEE